MTQVKNIAITPGEPAGIGPDILIQIAQQDHSHQLVAVCDPELLKQRAKQLKLPLNLTTWRPDQPAKASRAGHLSVYPTPMAEPAISGSPNTVNAPYVLQALRMATQGCLVGEFSALVTGPINKAIINEAGIHFSGHTEFLEDFTQSKKVVMMLATEGLKVALATTHLPLKDVPSAITKASLTQVIQVLHHDLKQDFGIQSPNILVAGLNPHAGEDGHMGTEEIETITPVLNELRSEGIKLIGPLPADTLFTPKCLDSADAVLAMYHDQGLPVLKYKGFGCAANITLGLPIIRTSVDHGTAFDLAGTSKANPNSLLTAIRYAEHMTEARDK